MLRRWWTHAPQFQFDACRPLRSPSYACPASSRSPAARPGQLTDITARNRFLTIRSRGISFSLSTNNSRLHCYPRLAAVGADGETRISAEPFRESAALKLAYLFDGQRRYMAKEKARFFWIGMLAVAFSVAHAQSPQQIEIQQAVDAEHAADENDHSQWVYLEEIRKPKEQVLQWASNRTTGGRPARPRRRQTKRLSPSQQRDLIQHFRACMTLEAQKTTSEAITAISKIDDLLQPTHYRLSLDANQRNTRNGHRHPAL